MPVAPNILVSTFTEQLAFLINTYYAWTLQLILTECPDLESMKDLGGLFSSPWKEAFIRLFGETDSLDYIEHDLVLGSDHCNDPCIHLAVNCASTGCPMLRDEAYTGARPGTGYPLVRHS